MFYDKCCVCINKYVFIIVKIKCINSDKINDICNKVNFIIKLHYFITSKTNVLSKNTQHFIKINTNITICVAASGPKNFRVFVIYCL